MKSNELRHAFLKYFQNLDHRKVLGDGLIPKGDSSLLFTTAGMVQFKSFYTCDSPPYSRATSVQKCLRAGGKHGDIENVGFTLRHNTFFEMLGNFSFGDYFKEEAISFAWDFIQNILCLPSERLWVSVYKDDHESKDIWKKKINFPSEKIVLLGSQDNFWGPAGSSGACGPCSEIYIDMGSESDPSVKEGDLARGGNRYLEFWNLVFPQYYQDPSGQRMPLKNKGVDTGMGLERLSFIMHKMINSDIKSIYETDLFSPMINAISSQTHIPYHKSERSDSAMHVIADHVRALTFLISENILPSNEGHGYVVRRILRRASRFASLLGVEDPFLYKIFPSVIETMGSVYDNILASQETVKKVILLEEKSFHKTLVRCETILQDVLKRSQDRGVIQGSDIFELYDTYGFPVEMLADFAKVNDLSLDMKNFQKNMDQQKERARKNWKGASIDFSDKSFLKNLSKYGATSFVGDKTLEIKATVLGSFYDEKNQTTALMTNKTPFYAKAGGQEGDRGVISLEGVSYRVRDTQKFLSGIIVHFCEGLFPSHLTGKEVSLSVEKKRRHQLSIHHTATHILHSVLRKKFGDSLRQAGSFIEEDYFRFDFTHFSAISQNDLNEIEQKVNDCLFQNIDVQCSEISLHDAKKENILMLFDEKYGEQVRVIRVGSQSKELCGGTHVQQTGDIGVFKILNEQSIASGIRRIVAVAGLKAFQEIQKMETVLISLQKSFQVSRDDILRKVKDMKDSLEMTQNHVKHLQKDLCLNQMMPLENHSFLFKDKMIGTFFLKFSTKHISPDKALIKDILDEICSRQSDWIVILGVQIQDRGQLIVRVPDHFASKQWNAGKILKLFAKQFNGKGGGNFRIAQGGCDSGVSMEKNFKNVQSFFETLYDKD